MKTAVFFVSFFFSLNIFGQTQVTYLSKGQVVMETLTDSALAKLPPISIIETKPTLYNMRKQTIAAKIGYVYLSINGDVIKQVGFASTWFDNKLRVYAYIKEKPVEVTEIFLVFEPLKQ